MASIKKVTAIYEIFDDEFKKIEGGENLDELGVGRIMTVLQKEFSDFELDKITRTAWAAVAQAIWQRIQSEHIFDWDPAKTEQFFREAVEKVITPSSDPGLN